MTCPSLRRGRANAGNDDQPRVRGADVHMTVSTGETGGRMARGECHELRCLLHTSAPRRTRRAPRSSPTFRAQARRARRIVKNKPIRSCGRNRPCFEIATSGTGRDRNEVRKTAPISYFALRTVSLCRQPLASVPLGRREVRCGEVSPAPSRTPPAAANRNELSSPLNCERPYQRTQSCRHAGKQSHKLRRAKGFFVDAAGG